jgi:hypothetical protein
MSDDNELISVATVTFEGIGIEPREIFPPVWREVSYEKRLMTQAEFEALQSNNQEQTYKFEI